MLYILSVLVPTPSLPIIPGYGNYTGFCRIKDVKHHSIQVKRIEPIFEGVFPQNEEFGGVCGTKLHKHPLFYSLVERKHEDEIALPINKS